MAHGKGHPIENPQGNQKTQKKPETETNPGRCIFDNFKERDEGDPGQQGPGRLWKGQNKKDRARQEEDDFVKRLVYFFYLNNKL